MKPWVESGLNFGLKYKPGIRLGSYIVWRSSDLNPTPNGTGIKTGRIDLWRERVY